VNPLILEKVITFMGIKFIYVTD